MASFRTHISFGIALGVLGAIGFVSLALAPEEWTLPVFVGLATVIGAILPDMDSDTGVPFHVTFGSLALIASGLALLYALKIFPGDLRFILGLPFGVLFGIWVVVGWMFKKFTVHRGMAHSIPAAFLSALVTYSLAARLGFSLQEAFFIGVALGLGYLLHLVLDELNSAVNFHGTPFVPNKALGSALKMVSQSSLMNVLVYGALVLLILVNGADLVVFSQALLARIAQIV